MPGHKSQNARFENCMLDDFWWFLYHFCSLFLILCITSVETSISRCSKDATLRLSPPPTAKATLPELIWILGTQFPSWTVPIKTKNDPTRSNYIMAMLYPAIPMSDLSAKPMNFKVSTLILGHPLDIGPWTTAEGKTTRAALENYWLAIVWAAAGNVWIVQQCRIWVRFHQSLKIIKNLNVSATSKQIA